MSKHSDDENLAELPRADLIWQHGWAFGRTAVLAAAVEIKLFDAFAAGPADVATLAARTGCSARGVKALADALVAMELLSRDEGGRFAPTAVARTYLGPDPAVDLGPQIIHSRQLSQRWVHLADCVRTGQPLPRDPNAPTGYFEQLVRQLFNGNYAAGQVLCHTLAQRDDLRFSPRRVVDLGAGAAPWSIPFAQASPDCQVLAIDYDNVLPVTREYAERFGVAEQFKYRAQPAETADLGEGKFDLVLVGHLYHSMGAAASADLARRAGRALRPGGLLAVAEFVVDDGRRGPLIPLLFGCNMLLGTEEGTSFTASQIDGWARDAGLTPIEPAAIPTGSAIRLAKKP